MADEVNLPAAPPALRKHPTTQNPNPSTTNTDEKTPTTEEAPAENGFFFSAVILGVFVIAIAYTIGDAGYSSELATPGSRFDINAFGSLLHTNYLGRTKIHLPTTASTMIDAKNILAEKPPSEAHGSIVIADRQTQAKGRKGRKWIASSIDNIYASFIWVPSQATIPPKTPQQLPTHLIKLNLAVPLAIARACSAEGVSYVGVKWPNDVWINGYKVAGALIDYIGRQGHSGAVVGVGINTNENVKDVLVLGGKNKAISIRDALGYPVERERVLAVVLAELEALMKLPLNLVINEFTKLDVLVGNVVTVHHVSKEVKDSRDFQARVLHISQDGLVVTNLKTGDEVTLSSEEVSISLPE